MADSKNQNQPQAQTPEAAPENPRKAIRERREARLRVIAGPSNMVTVYPANNTLREILRHANGTGFIAGGNQGAAWPNDSFTHRRLADGSVSLESGAGGEPEPADETKNPREQAAAYRPKKAEPPREATTNGRPAAKSQPTPEPQPNPAA